MSLDQAITTARYHIPIMQRIRKPEYCCGFAIVSHNGSYHVYDADAWQQPTETPLLPWTPPQGTRVAYVAMDGSVTQGQP